jgi:CRISPR-associated protein Csd1
VERLNSYITGYNAHIEDKKDDIVIMGVDSAVPGRMAITYYRKLEKSEYLDRIKAWHINFAWYQNYNTDLSKQHKRLRFVGAPAPEDIAWAAYCTDRIKIPDKLDKDLLGTTVERILPCIIDGQQFPLDLVQSVINRVSNRTGLKPAEWEKCLGIACALYKGYYKEKEMSLDENRDDRDYLYGRLLAVAEEIESFALRIADEHRLTNAERLMQRFSDSPFSTWKTIRESLEPYIRRINASKYRGRLIGYKELLDEIKALFKYDEYKSNERLSGLYLLGYHCQRRWLRIHKRKDGKWILKPSDNIAPKNTEGTNGNTQQEN